MDLAAREGRREEVLRISRLVGSVPRKHIPYAQRTSGTSNALMITELKGNCS